MPGPSFEASEEQRKLIKTLAAPVGRQEGSFIETRPRQTLCASELNPRPSRRD